MILIDIAHILFPALRWVSEQKMCLEYNDEKNRNKLFTVKMRDNNGHYMSNRY